MKDVKNGKADKLTFIKVTIQFSWEHSKFDKIFKKQDLKINLKIDGNFLEKITETETEFPKLYKRVLKNTGLSVEKPCRWSPYHFQTQLVPRKQNTALNIFFILHKSKWPPRITVINVCFYKNSKVLGGKIKVYFWFKLIWQSFKMSNSSSGTKIQVEFITSIHVYCTSIF